VRNYIRKGVVADTANRRSSSYFGKLFLMVWFLCTAQKSWGCLTTLYHSNKTAMLALTYLTMNCDHRTLQVKMFLHWISWLTPQIYAGPSLPSWCLKAFFLRNRYAMFIEHRKF